MPQRQHSKGGKGTCEQCGQVYWLVDWTVMEEGLDPVDGADINLCANCSANYWHDRLCSALGLEDKRIVYCRPTELDGGD